MRNYGNTLVYKIMNTYDPTDTNIYIGCTTDLYRCKQNHKRRYHRGDSCNLYDYIREKGGWDNFELVMLGRYDCADCFEAKQKLYEHIQEMKPSLNLNCKKEEMPKKSYSNLLDF